MSLSVPHGVGAWSHSGDGVHVLRSPVGRERSDHLECLSGGLRWARVSDRLLSGILNGAMYSLSLTPCPSYLPGTLLSSVAYLLEEGLWKVLPNP